MCKLNNTHVYSHVYSCFCVVVHIHTCNLASPCEFECASCGSFRYVLYYDVVLKVSFPQSAFMFISLKITCFLTLECYLSGGGLLQNQRDILTQTYENSCYFLVYTTFYHIVMLVFR